MVYCEIGYDFFFQSHSHYWFVHGIVSLVNVVCWNFLWNGCSLHLTLYPKQYGTSSPPLQPLDMVTCFRRLCMVKSLACLRCFYRFWLSLYQLLLSALTFTLRMTQSLEGDEQGHEKFSSIMKSYVCLEDSG